MIKSAAEIALIGNGARIAYRGRDSANHFQTHA